MPRKQRFWHPDVFFHVIMRGNNRQYIFNDRSDMNELFRVFSYVYDRSPFTIISYCIMSNHYHLLIRSSEVPLSKIMMLANKRYTEYYKKKYHFTGQLYEKRYYASPIFDGHGILEVSRYIHRNPIETQKPMEGSLHALNFYYAPDISQGYIAEGDYTAREYAYVITVPNDDVNSEEATKSFVMFVEFTESDIVSFKVVDDGVMYDQILKDNEGALELQKLIQSKRAGKDGENIMFRMSNNDFIGQLHFSNDIVYFEIPTLDKQFSSSITIIMKHQRHMYLK